MKKKFVRYNNIRTIFIKNVKIPLIIKKNIKKLIFILLIIIIISVVDNADIIGNLKNNEVYPNKPWVEYFNVFNDIYNLTKKALDNTLPIEEINNQSQYLYEMLKKTIIAYGTFLKNYFIIIKHRLLNKVENYFIIINTNYSWLIAPVKIILISLSNVYEIVSNYYTNLRGYIVPETTIKENLYLWFIGIGGIIVPIHLVLTGEFCQYACIGGGEHNAYVQVRRDFPQYGKKGHVTGDDVWHYITFLLISYILEMRENHGYIIAIRNYLRLYVHTNRIYGEEEATQYRDFPKLGEGGLDPETTGKVANYKKGGIEPEEDTALFKGRAPRYGKEWSWWADGCHIGPKKKYIWYGRGKTFYEIHENQLKPIVTHLAKKEPELFNNEQIIFWQMPFLTEGNLQKKGGLWFPSFFAMPTDKIEIEEINKGLEKKITKKCILEG